MLQVSCTGVVYSQQETPHAFRRAIALLEDRLRELESSTEAVPGKRRSPSDGNAVAAAPVGGGANGTGDVGSLRPRSGPAAAPRSAGRWFQHRWPRVTLSSGEQVTFHSQEEVMRFLERNGLRPHKRGDASMLLWQIRRRLGLEVDAVAGP